MNNYLIMGVLNVTPDSFSDGGQFVSVDRAIRQALLMVSEGAHIIDVGGESSRPGAQAISASEELDRVAPVIEKLSQAVDVRISVDTRKYEVACDAVSLGATLLNDISGGADLRMAQLACAGELDVILMHMNGEPGTMQLSPEYPEGVVPEVKRFLRDRVRAFEEVGVAPERIWVDPGIGFGKQLGDNLELLDRIGEFSDLAGRVVVGTSRKSFLATVLEEANLPMDLRREGTLASNLWAYQNGATVFRVHDVGPLARALKTWDAIRGTRRHSP
ncbi:MAG: dihydropteroate synthase, partial [Deltaproteobacteria bacterium]|nr:dihydropteroate synthase [Deltaproteobacteria bacterium]